MDRAWSSKYPRPASGELDYCGDHGSRSCDRRYGVKGLSVLYGRQPTSTNDMRPSCDFPKVLTRCLADQRRSTKYHRQNGEAPPGKCSGRISDRAWINEIEQMRLSRDDRDLCRSCKRYRVKEHSVLYAQQVTSTNDMRPLDGAAILKPAGKIEQHWNGSCTHHAVVVPLCAGIIASGSITAAGAWDSVNVLASSSRE